VKNIPLAKSNALKGINSPANDFKAIFGGTTADKTLTLL
jgi:hypothetical protein